MIAAFWNKLDKRQRLFVCAGAVIVVVLLFYEFAWSPFRESAAKAEKSIAANTARLHEMARLDESFSRQEAKISQIRRSMAARKANFTLFSYLDQKAMAAGVKGRIRQMNSVAGAKTASFEETLVEMKLDKLTMKQLTEFLFYVESPGEMVRIKRLTIARMKESPDYLSVSMLVASYLPSMNPGGQ